MADLRKNKKKEQSPLAPKNLTEIEHTLLYPSKTRMDLDADQFVQYPQILERREPSMQPYGMKLAKVEIVDKVMGNPPQKKHELKLKLHVSGIPEKIEGWKHAANSFSGMHSTMTASEALRDYHAKKGQDVHNKDKTD